MIINYEASLLDQIINKNKIESICSVYVSSEEADEIMASAVERNMSLQSKSDWFAVGGLDVVFYLEI